MPASKSLWRVVLAQGVGKKLRRVPMRKTLHLGNLERWQWNVINFELFTLTSSEIFYFFIKTPKISKIIRKSLEVSDYLFSLIVRPQIDDLVRKNVCKWQN